MDVFEILEFAPGELREEAQRAIAAIRDVVGVDAEVFEVGSTSLEGVIGKGDIDILVRASAERFADTRRVLDERFERNSNQMSNEQYQGYTVSSDYDVAIQLTVAGCTYDTFTAFMGALAGDAARIAAYNQLKRNFDGAPMDTYRRAKVEFIEKVLAEVAGEFE
jgi:GrpB-like predicted nucleotidyltransferase (UPF0157 family)